jgi:hypothetical protein
MGVIGRVETERPPTPIERRAEQAERRADAGLAPRPGDERAKAIAAGIREREEIARQRERSREAVVSTLDVLSTVVKDAAREVAGSGRERRRPASAAPMRPADRWYLEDSGRAGVATPADKPSLDDELGDEPRNSSQVSGSAGAAASDEDPAASSGDAVANAVGGGPLAPTAALPWWTFLALGGPYLLVVAWFGLLVRPKLLTRAELVAAASRMILILGLINFIFEAALLVAIPTIPASLFLPWSWRESLKPIAPLLACWLLLSLGLAVAQESWSVLGVKVLTLPFIFAPALVLCYYRLRWHEDKFKTGFVGRRFLEMRREYQQARAVHESLFPKPFTTEWMRFDFGYRPAAEIGGDFIHAWIGPDGRFYLTLIDVTGHGLASAMSVARIHGEIERLRDEHPDEGPAKLLARLNRYFHRLLARHRLYATGILLTIDPRTGEMRYASAGHPPIFHRSKGQVTELASTTFMLGAVDNDVFGEDEVTIQLEVRDTLILFTDGAYDAKNPRGERFGIEQLRDTIARPIAPPKWTQFLMRLLETFEAGVAEDDLLIAEITLLQQSDVRTSRAEAMPSNWLATTPGFDE